LILKQYASLNCAFSSIRCTVQAMNSWRKFSGSQASK